MKLLLCFVPFFTPAITITDTKPVSCVNAIVMREARVTRTHGNCPLPKRTKTKTETNPPKIGNQTRAFIYKQEGSVRGNNLGVARPWIAHECPAELVMSAALAKRYVSK